MEDKKLLIVGIDPGTTIGFAVLDIESNLLNLTSSKQLDLNLLISKTVGFGKVVLVGTDKAKVPSLVSEFAAKFGAKIVSPEEDIKVDEKRKMVDNFIFGDEHQSDALASALFAYKETKPLLDKIDTFSRENKKYEIKNKIKEIVITKKISIKSAVAIIERKDEESKIMEKVIEEKKLSENDFLKLYNKMKMYESEIRILKNYNFNLTNRIINLEKRQSKKENIKIYDRKLGDFKENRIKFLENAVRMRAKDNDELKLLVKKFNAILSNVNDFYILKRLDTLGISEFTFKNKILNVKRNDMLLVDNPNIASSSLIELLKNKIFIIVYKTPISKKIENSLPFVFVNTKNLKIEEDKYFGFVEKRHFEIEKGRYNWIKKIVDDYKKEKEQLIS